MPVSTSADDLRVTQAYRFLDQDGGYREEKELLLGHRDAARDCVL